MKIIILGSGYVGVELARYLVSAGNAVTLVDNPSDELTDIVARLDLRVVRGNPSSPAVLRSAGAENTELLVAATADDECNITACCIGASLFRIPRKIARLRSPDYLREASELFGPNRIPIDHVISPETLVTENVADLIALPGASAVAKFFGGQLVVAAATVTAAGRLFGRPVAQFSRDAGKTALLALFRRGKWQRPDERLTFRQGDEVFFCAERTRALNRLADLREIDTGWGDLTVSGGTHIAEELARQLSERYRVKLIEPEAAHSRRTAERLRGTGVEIYNADPADPDFIKEEGIDRSDLFIAAAAADENNIMAALILSRLYHVRTLALIRGDGYFDLASGSRSDIDTIISPNEATISALLTHIRQTSVAGVHLFRQGQSEALELVVAGSKFTSRVAGRKVADLPLPEGVTLGMLMRDGRMEPITPATVLTDGDRVLAFLAARDAMRPLTGLFRPRPFWIPRW